VRIALTGGIACGKSLLARYLSEMGVRTIDADDVVHELEASGGAAVAPIVAQFGESVRAASGGIDRQRLAEMVFGRSRTAGGQDSRTIGQQEESPPGRAGRPRPAARAALESILFPMVRKRILEFIDSTPTVQQQLSLLTTNNYQLTTISIIPLLFESHWDSDYDIIISLVSEHEVQIRRMAETRGMSREQAEARINAQLPVAEKAARADYVIENNSTPEALKAESLRLVEWLKSKIRD